MIVPVIGQQVRGHIAHLLVVVVPGLTARSGARIEAVQALIEAGEWMA
jgi:hypothetical protein